MQVETAIDIDAKRSFQSFNILYICAILMNDSFARFFRGEFPVLLMLMLLSTSMLSAQTGRKINIKSANTLEFDDRVDAQRLVGNVIFEHDGTLLYCDSAYLYDKENRLEAYSNVRIVGDSVVVTGQNLTYDGKTKIADIVGNVRMTDPSSVLTTNRLQFDNNTKQARYTIGGKIISEKNELVSQFGMYNSTNRTFYFRKNVKLTNKDYVMVCDTLQYSTVNKTSYFFGPTTITSKNNLIYCENGYYNTKTDISEFGKNARLDSKKQQIRAEKLFYNRKTGDGRARQNVRISDTSQAVVLTGHFADYNEFTGRILMTDSAVMEKEFGKDTLFLHGDTLRSVLDTVTDKRTLFAYHKVKFFKKDFQGRCDSLTYSELDSMMRLYKDPVIWNEENQLTADTVRIQLANNNLETLYLRTNGFIASQEDSVHFNQISGRNVTGYFVKNELVKIEVVANGESVYYAQGDGDGYMGVNKAICNDMNIYIDSNKVQSITFISDPNATLYPVNEPTKEEIQLRGLRWLGEHRPAKRSDIFIWKNAPAPVKPARRRQKA